MTETAHKSLVFRIAKPELKSGMSKMTETAQKSLGLGILKIQAKSGVNKVTETAPKSSSFVIPAETLEQVQGDLESESKKSLYVPPHSLVHALFSSPISNLNLVQHLLHQCDHRIPRKVLSRDS